MKQILVASDFSKSAANALEYAMSLAKVLNMEVVVLHAILPTEGVDNNMYNAFYIKDYYKNKREALKEWVGEFTGNYKYSGVEVSTLCEVGLVKNVITKYISENHVELLVIGITGATGIAGIVGSNASTLVSIVNIPTLVIPIESKFSPSPSLTLATDYETKLSADDVNALNEMVLAFGSAKMQVLYVGEKSDVKYVETGESRLQELIKHSELEFNYINQSKPLSGILEFIEKNDTDILCLVKHHHNVFYRLFTRSTVNQVMNKTVKAILVLHE